MNHIVLSMVTLGLSLAPVVCRAAEPNPEQAKTIAEINKLGGKITVDEKSPGKPVKGDACPCKCGCASSGKCSARRRATPALQVRLCQQRQVRLPKEATPALQVRLCEEWRRLLVQVRLCHQRQVRLREEGRRLTIAHSKPSGVSTFAACDVRISN